MIENLKILLKKYNIDGYIVPKNDEYFNEYIHYSEDKLKFITNFSGSAGFAIVFKDKNYLFVDGRYTVQANIQSGKKFKVFTYPNKYPKNVLKFKRKIILGFDPKLHTKKQLKFLFDQKNIKLRPITTNLINYIWANKPKEIIKPFYALSSKNTGLSFERKIKKIKNFISKNKVDYLLVTAPENSAWVLNIRGHDCAFSPIPNTRLLIGRTGKVKLFTNIKKTKKIKRILQNEVDIYEEKKLQNIIGKLEKKIVWVDSSSCSFYYNNKLNKKNKVISRTDPIHIFKSIKNNVEITNMRKSHLIDGIALTKFLFWLKKNYKKNKITEMSAQKKLEKFRKKNSTYKFPSFDTISGSGPNSAIIHYKATEKTNRVLKEGDLYLVDSGGQYSFGTTDVTRTISLNNNSSYVKDIYTRVLKGHIAVSRFRIKKKSTGSEVDFQARRFLQEKRLDYPHGTGHGVGYFLNVHEGPQSLSKNSKVFLRDGMILSNEPGYYKKNTFGIRIENLIFIKKNKFEELTLVPIEKNLINKKILNKKEIDWINNYHKKINNNLIKFMNKNEKKYLKMACSPI